MKLGSAEMVDFGLGEYLTQYPSKRYPIYTRGNAGEVWPEVAYPLTITLTRTVGEEASAQAAINAGVISRKDIVEGPSCFGGVFAGYMYLNLSFGRMIAVRTPGTTIEKSDATYYGSEQQAPKYVPHKNDKNFLASMKLIRYGWRMLHTTEISFLEPDRQLVHHWEERLPKILKSTDQELVSTLREIMQPVMHLFTNHLDVTGQAGGAVQLLSTVCEERLNDRSLALTLLGSLGDVDSAAPSFALWELGRMVANDPTLTSFFDEGITELEERLRESQDCQLFIDNFDSFLKEFGSRGPNEWETACETWGTEPSNVLVLIDRMRLADAEKSPTHRAGQLLKNREQALSDSRSQLKGFGLWIFNKALHGSVLFSQARERSKTTIINLIHVARLISRELAKRTAAQSEKGELIDLWFVLETELDDIPQFEIINHDTKITDAVINENDIVATEELKFGDNDRLSAIVAIVVKAEKLVLITNQEGLFDSDPQKSKNAEKAEANGKEPTREHVYPRNMTLRLDLFEPKTPLIFRDFVYHYVSKGGLFSKTTPTENRKVAKFHRENPRAIMSEHWPEIYKNCKIKKA